MSTTLTGRLISNTYKQLLKIDVSTNTGISTALTTIVDGDGSATALQVATSAAQSRWHIICRTNLWSIW